jgi:hypothetical protein
LFIFFVVVVVVVGLTLIHRILIFILFPQLVQFGELKSSSSSSSSARSSINYYFNFRILISISVPDFVYLG